MTGLIAVALVATLAVGLLLGALIGYAAHGRRRPTTDAEFTAATAATQQAVLPMRSSLDDLQRQVRELESSGVRWQAQLHEQVELVRSATDGLRHETASLATALRKPQVRGRWGELHLRRAVELAGLVDRCDFDTQVSTAGIDGTVRPDMVVRLAGGKNVVVDAKVPLAAFLDAAECAAGSPGQQELLAAHARQLRTHVELLAGKQYWRRLSPTPEFVVLFVPAEAFLSAALEADPTLLEEAAERRVVLATPTTLIALLRTVAFAWSQETLSTSAQQVFELGREVYDRLGVFGGHLDKLGRALTGGVAAYNSAVGSLETRVLVTARRLRSLGVTDHELTAPRPVEQAVRPLTAAELVGDGAAELVGDGAAETGPVVAAAVTTAVTGPDAPRALRDASNGRPA